MLCGIYFDFLLNKTEQLGLTQTLLKLKVGNIGLIFRRAGLSLKRNLGRVAESALILIAEWRFSFSKSLCLSVSIAAGCRNVGAENLSQDSCLHCNRMQKCWLCRWLGHKDDIIMMEGQEGDNCLLPLPHEAMYRRQLSANQDGPLQKPPCSTLILVSSLWTMARFYSP